MELKIVSDKKYGRKIKVLGAQVQYVQVEFPCFPNQKFEGINEFTVGLPGRTIVVPASTIAHAIKESCK